jgi:mannose-6-phosphate isomerase-like protein (cupin superfamily)
MPDCSIHRFISINYNTIVPPWVSLGVYANESSEEIYYLLQGKLWVLVGGLVISLMPQELLLVKPQVPHAIVKSRGTTKIFGIRTPARNDNHFISKIPDKYPPVNEEKVRELRRDWGYRIQVSKNRKRNFPLIGIGDAQFYSPYIVLTYQNFPTVRAENPELSKQSSVLHLHKESWEYYLTIKGSKILQVENEILEIRSGEIIEVPPQAQHNVIDLETPYQGLVFRSPILPDKVEYQGP